ncbi:MAG: septal ring lytic transglycosylase RlpA family protein [Desulfarculales bacterium]|jgi:rare lipoprotein A|nr:septal ring lytic transglycosylase RlpA family protein [Desulfarculales bacterium]
MWALLRESLIFLSITLLISFSCLSCGSKKATYPDGSYPVPATTKPDGTPLPTQRPYTVNGRTYNPLPTAEGYRETGIASWYGPNFHGRSTSNGEKYDMEAMTAAHKTLPMNTWVQVANIKTGQSAVVRVNDRGPFVDKRIIDLSKAAARQVGVLAPGTAMVEVTALGYRRQGTGVNNVPAQYEQPASYNEGMFTVQVGAFTNQNNAERLAGQIRANWGETFVVRYDRGDQIFYRVRVGRFTRLEQAEALQSKLRDAGLNEAITVGW